MAKRRRQPADYMDLETGPAAPSPFPLPADELYAPHSQPPAKPKRKASKPRLTETERAFAELVLPRIDRVVYARGREGEVPDDALRDHFQALHDHAKTGQWPADRKTVRKITAGDLTRHLRYGRELNKYCIYVRSRHASGYTLLRVDVDAHQGQTDAMALAQRIRSELRMGYICDSENGVSLYIWLINPPADWTPSSTPATGMTPAEIETYREVLHEEGYGRMADALTTDNGGPRQYSGKKINAIIRLIEQRVREVAQSEGYASTVDAKGGVMVWRYERDKVLTQVEYAPRTKHERPNAAKLPYCSCIEDVHELAAAELSVDQVCRILHITSDDIDAAVADKHPSRSARSSKATKSGARPGDRRPMEDRGDTLANTRQALAAAMIELQYRNNTTDPDGGNVTQDVLLELAMARYAEIPGRDNINDAKRVRRFRDSLRYMLRHRDESTFGSSGGRWPAWFDEEHIAAVEIKLRSVISRDRLDTINETYKAREKLTYRMLAVIACCQAKNVHLSNGCAPTKAVRRMLEHARHLGRSISGSVVSAGLNLLHLHDVIRCVRTTASRGVCRVWQVIKTSWFTFVGTPQPVDSATPQVVDQIVATPQVVDFRAGKGGDRCPQASAVVPTLSLPNWYRGDHLLSEVWAEGQVVANLPAWSPESGENEEIWPDDQEI